MQTTSRRCRRATCFCWKTAVRYPGRWHLTLVAEFFLRDSDFGRGLSSFGSIHLHSFCLSGLCLRSPCVYLCTYGSCDLWLPGLQRLTLSVLPTLVDVRRIVRLHWFLAVTQVVELDQTSRSHCTCLTIGQLLFDFFLSLSLQLHELFSFWTKYWLDGD